SARSGTSARSARRTSTSATGPSTPAARTSPPSARRPRPPSAQPRPDIGDVPIREWPEAIRPRERLIRDGPPALSDAQLLALLIGSGTSRRSALAMAEALLHSIGGAAGLARADLAALGLGPATAARVVAALELGRRALAAEREG